MRSASFSFFFSSTSVFSAFPPFRLRRHPRRHLRQTSTWTSRLQWAAPGLNSELQIAVGSAGPQQRAPDCSGQRRASGGPGADWATPDLNRGALERSGEDRTSAARRCVRRCVRNMLEKNVKRYVRNECQKECRRNVRRYVR